MRLRTTLTLLLAAWAVAAASSSILVSRQLEAVEPVADAYGVGSPDVFLKKYLAYRTRQQKEGNATTLRVKLGYVRGLSRSFTGTAGEFVADLGSGRFTVKLSKLDPLRFYSLWVATKATPRTAAGTSESSSPTCSA